MVGYAKAGIDGIEHIWSVGYSSILDLNKRNKLAVDRTAGRIDAEEAGAFYGPHSPFVPAKAGTQGHLLEFFDLPHWVPLARGRTVGRGVAPYAITWRPISRTLLTPQSAMVTSSSLRRNWIARATPRSPRAPRP